MLSDRKRASKGLAITEPLVTFTAAAQASYVNCNSYISSMEPCASDLVINQFDSWLFSAALGTTPNGAGDFIASLCRSQMYLTTVIADPTDYGFSTTGFA